MILYFYLFLCMLKDNQYYKKQVLYMRNKHSLKIFALSLILLLGSSRLWADGTYLDTFSSVSYANNDGTEAFSSDWTESGDDNDPNSGSIRIDNQELLFDAIKSKQGISRTLDLSGATNDTVILTFDYIPNSSSGDKLSLSLYDGNNNIVIATFSGSTSGTYRYKLDDIYKRADAKITFSNEGSYPWDTIAYIRIDNLKFSVCKDSDGDGVCNADDIDDDNDGILDAVEMQGAGPCAYGFFQVIGGQLKLFDSVYSTYLDIGKQKLKYNGLAFDKNTGKLYASVRASGNDDEGTAIANGDIVEVDRYSGRLKLVYDGTDDTISSAESSAADFYDGTYYYRSTDDGKKLYTWTPNDTTVNQIGSDNLRPLDMAIIVSSSSAKAYGAYSPTVTSGTADNTKFYTINLQDGSISNVRMTVTTPDGADLATGWGAAFAANGNELYLVNNNGYIYRIDNYDTATPSATFVYRSVTTSSNDGASCRDANQTPPDSDGDGIPDYLDLDSDNDGIADNVEAQNTGSYQAPSGTDSDGDGLDDSYDDNTNGLEESLGLIPPDRDNDLQADFLDSDSDNDGYTDCEEGTTLGAISGNCPAVTIRGDGFPDWAVENTIPEYGDINGKVDNPQDTDQMQNETGNTDEMGWREFLCGKNLTTLTRRNWKLISIPCDTGNNGVESLFQNTLGSYGEPTQGHWVVYRQSAADNYEVNASHLTTDKTKLNASDPLEQGIGYWIIWDDGQGTQEVNLTIEETLNGISPTPLTSTVVLNIDNADFNNTYLHALPNNDIAQGNDYKKYMGGNPFPYAFSVRNLYFSHDPANNDYLPIGDNRIDAYINPVFYKHDSSDRSGEEIANGGGYEAVSPNTPGFDNGGIKAMEGFFIKLEAQQGDTASNYFAYPLIEKNGNGN